MAQIFISYSKQDIEFARHLRTLLQNAGFDAWLDERLVPSTQWWRMLEGQIKSSTAFIVIMSPFSAESRWVEREILVAENANLPIFPVLLAGGGWSRLADIQYEDFTAGLNATLPQRFIAALRAVLDGTTNTSPIAQPIKTPVSQTESRLLESAMPAETVAGSDTEMWAKISLPDSAGLRSELPAVVPSGDVIQRDDARTTSFPFRFPTDPQTGEKLPAQVLLKASSADFIVRSPGGDDSEYVELPPDSDSRTIIFTLLPKPGGRTSGRARVFLDLIYESRVIAQISVSTKLVDVVSRIQDNVIPWSMWSVPVGSASAGASGYDTPSAVPGEAVLEREESPKRDQYAASDADLDDMVFNEESGSAASPPPATEVDETRSEDWRGALPPTPFPRPPSPITQPKVIEPPASSDRSVDTNETAVSQRPQFDREDRQNAPSKPAPEVRPRGRVISFPAVSAIAGMAFVFVIVFLVMNNNAQQPVIQATLQESTNTALSAATREAEIGLTSAANEVRFATQTALADVQSLTLTPPSTIIPPTTSDRTGIAVTRLIGCAPEDLALALINLIGEIDLEADALPSATDDEAIEAHRAEMESGSRAIVIRGLCEDAGQGQEVILHADILAAPDLTSAGLLQPTEVEIRVSVEDMNDPEGAAANYLLALSQYLRGEFDSILLNRLLRVYDAIEDNPLGVSGAMELNLLMGITHLLFENGYAPALSRFLIIDAATDSDPLILNLAIAARINAGAAEIAHAIAVIGDSEAFDTAVANAELYLDQASDMALDAQQQGVIQINRSILETLILTRQDD